MSESLQLTTADLIFDGRQMAITVEKPASTSIKLTWKLPANPSAYAGAVVLLSESKFNSENSPDDGTRYIGSTDWTAPVDKIGDANVVASFYKFFGEAIDQTTVTVDNIDPNKIYYASIHAASNILQYYSVGCVSYPLESSRFEKASDTYAGSIPTSSEPPANPSNGQVYFDKNQNTVLIWNDDLGSWARTSQDTVQTGRTPPLDVGRFFWNGETASFQYFDGNEVTSCNASNTRVKMGAVWAPFNSGTFVNTLPDTPSVGDVVLYATRAIVSAPPVYETKVFTLGTWFNVAPSVVQVLVGTAWKEITQGDAPAVSVTPKVPSIGDFFYSTSVRDLLVWAGTDAGWVKADTEDEGTPTSDKTGVGTDGSYTERMRLIEVLKAQLGYPHVCVELNETHFNIAIDNALDTFRQLADNAYAQRHMLMTLKKGQQTYYLNDPRLRTDKIVSIAEAYRLTTLGMNSYSGDNGIYAQQFFNQFYANSNVDFVSLHLFAQLNELTERMFASKLQFYWEESSRQLVFLNNIVRDERILLEVSLERTEQELLVDRYCKQWLQAWAQSESWEMLGEIRSKYGTLPGPNGGITLNGDACISRSETMQAELRRQINDFEVGNGSSMGNWQFFMG